MRPPRGQIGEKVSESEGLEHSESWPFGSHVLLLDMVALFIEILAVFNWDSLGLYLLQHITWKCTLTWWCPQSQMSASVSTTRSQLCLKRLLDEPQVDSLKCKRARLAPPPTSTGISPCLRPTSPAPTSNSSQSSSRVGSYFLFERCEREETYRAVHVHTQQQYTCQVTLRKTSLLLLIRIEYMLKTVLSILQK